MGNASRWAGAVACGLLAACSGGAPAQRASVPVPVDAPAAAVVTTSPAVPARPPSTAPGVGTWTGDGTPAPVLRNTGTDYVAIFASLDRYRRWLQAHHPDPALVARVWVEGTPIAQHFAGLFAQLQRDHHRWVDVDDRSDAHVVSVLDGAATLLVEEHTTAVQLVDDAGAVVKTIPQGPVFHWVVLLERDRHDRWRIASVDRQVTNDTEVAL